MTTNDVVSCTPDEEKVTKATLRFKVWNLMENKDLVNFPRPCKGRIPNFVESRAAAEKLASLDIFKAADIIKVNIDKSQEPVRFAVLEAGKTLLVPLPRLSEGILMKVNLQDNSNKQKILRACKRKGIDEIGQVISQDEKIHIDMLVLGSVAVSKEGHRIGKGEGFSDLEYGLMAATGLVSDKTVIVTTVHDEQVFDTLPSDLFQPFDVPVDWIVTPTRIIQVDAQLPRPPGILWNFVSDRRLQLIPVLKELRNKDMEEGKDCPLKDVDSEPEDRPKPYYRRSFFRRPFMRQRQPMGRDSMRQRRPISQDSTRQRRPISQDSSQPRPVSRDSMRRRRPTSRESGRTQSPHEAPRRTRTFRRGGQPRRRVDGSGDASTQVNGLSDRSEQRERREPRERIRTQVNGENKENQLPQRQRPFQRGQGRFFRKRLPVDFSVKVGNIASNVRVRDLKAALMEKGVSPRYITWKGPKGFALLHFGKVKPEEPETVAEDDVIASLQGLTVKCQSKEDISESHLSVEPAKAKPTSRIEDAGITAV